MVLYGIVWLKYCIYKIFLKLFIKKNMSLEQETAKTSKKKSLISFFNLIYSKYNKIK